MALLLGNAGPASAIEFFDGRFQIYGYYEMQTRVLAQNFDTSDGYNLAQWWHIANVEVEWDAAPEGWGPFDLISAYMRVEARYDCVWTAGCYIVPNYKNRYGNDAERLPDRLSNARKSGLVGSITPSLVERDPATGEVIQKIDYRDNRRRIQTPLDRRSGVYGAPRPDQAGGVGGLGDGRVHPHRLAKWWNVPSLSELFFGSNGLDDEWGTADDPGFYTLENFLDWEFALKRNKGNVGGRAEQTLGPWRPKDKIPLAGALRDRANPFRGPCDPNVVPITDSCDIRPARGDAPELEGNTELPFRPAPLVAFQQDGIPDAGLDTAQGNFVPNAGYLRLLERSDLRLRPDLNFSQTELSLNHGASQGPWNELKEAYVDLEMFDHRLWLRLGRQTIVWGKTELFRAQDQFNPQDVGLASLPSLEESRVPLWSVRGVWSFYDVGPFTDVRLEAAMNWDEFKPIDTGRCGEPFAPRPACSRMIGFVGNAITGTGVAGELRPGYPWEHWDALEGGLRLEFRHDRVSYALTWFNGRSDTPHTEVAFAFTRNVDPESGRPRVEGADGRCDTPGQKACLGQLIDDPSFGLIQIDPLREALEDHHANVQIFTTICGATVTFSDLLPEGCGFNIFNSVEPSTDEGPLAAIAPTLSMGFSSALAGRGPSQTVIPLGLPPFLEGLRAINSKTVLFTLGRFGDYNACGGPCGLDSEDDMPLVPLYSDLGDYDGTQPSLADLFPVPDPNSSDDNWFCQRLDARLGPCGQAPANFTYNFWRPQGAAHFLSDAQEALIGCGRFWGTDCDVDGFDLLNTEGSAFFEAWPGIEGTDGGIWDTYGLQNRPIPKGADHYLQPGTLDSADADAHTFYATSVQRDDAELPVCSRNARGGRRVLPGCATRTPDKNAMPTYGFPGLGSNAGGGLDPNAPRPANPQALKDAPLFKSEGHPFTGDPFRNELAALSWNALMTLVVSSVVPETEDDGCADKNGVQRCPQFAMDGMHDQFQLDGVAGRFDQFNPLQPFALDRCSFRNPILCSSLSALLQASQTNAKSVRAAGNGQFGRRDFVWHGGAQVVLDYQRRNVTGFAMDFAEDRTRTNWNVELSWFHQVRFSDNNSFDLTTGRDTVNLVVSIDRPTFLRPLNKNRTFFLNAQFFLQGIPGWKNSFVSNGPVNALMTFSVFTGYFQDRLLPSLQLVYDVNSESGAFLWAMGYRISQNLLLQFGLNAFWGHVQNIQSPVQPIGTTGIGVGRGEGSQRAYVENGLTVVRDRDEIFLRLRYNF